MNHAWMIVMPTACLSFVGCAPAPTGGSAVRDVPVLKSSHLEKTWGRPGSDPLATGGQVIHYTHPGQSLEMVMIYSLPNAERVPRTPPPVKYQVENPDPRGSGLVTRTRPQEWRETTILGQTVKWFQVDEGGGADWPAFETVVFPLTHPDGRTGHYRIRVMAMTPGNAAKVFPRVNW